MLAAVNAPEDFSGKSTMKLRIKGTAIRLRRDRKGLDELVTTDQTQEALRLGPGRSVAFSCSVEIGNAHRGQPRANYGSGRLVLFIDGSDAREWRGSDRVGFDHEQVAENAMMRIILERDFACFDRPSGDESDDAYAFQNPSDAC
ncbi:DUF7009 family protein [Schlesneria paludicola]|uniref:DUF7009 family protein n=1 Tax=Schlesneria paludicola TaxID=360056 RepID=UPI00029A3F47